MDGDRFKTYIKHFDEAMEGGVPHGHVVLVSGTSGTMKSSIILNMLYRNAMEGKHCVYFSLEQSGSSLLDHASRMGMNFAPLGNKFRLVDLAMIRKNLKHLEGSSWLEVFKMQCKTLNKEQPFDLLAIDSLAALEILAKFKNPREDLFTFFEYLRDMDYTSFLISEMTMDSKSYSQHDEDFLSDGIIHLSMAQVGEIDIQRRIRCVKMRSTNHNTGFFTLLFKDGEFYATRTIVD